ncbi:MAG: D-alanyl-D-alanine carboxypeptidase, partial [Desulfotomaculaceae bacterium]|nr:D-alanyl-D-alanine carboxypeptidase [Desulfotomaculaceae bacterium]
DRVVTVSPKAASVGEASIDLKAGEKLTLDDLIYGAMLKSGNDACVAIAEHVAGTESNFVLLMNQKAKVLGALNTSFINTNGLPATGHFTTARDLAIITRYALRNQSFQKAVSTRGKLIRSTEGERYLNNTNRLLWSYDGANGVKTGTTVEAGECLVASATRDGRQLINVVLHSEDRWSDSTTLLDYGFECFDQVLALQEQESFGWIAVREGTGDKVQAVVSNDLKVVIPKNRPDLIEKKVEITRELTAPVWDGQKVGRVIVSVNGIETESVDLVSDRYVEKLPFYRYIFKKGQQYYADGKGILFGITNTLKIAFWGGFYADG